MENIKVSMRYAKAVYTVAKQQGNIKDFIQDLATIVELINQSRELKLLVVSPIISQSKKINVFTELFKDKVSLLTLNFILLLVSKNREKYINEINHCINLLYNKERNIVECQVVSAFELNENTKTKVELFLKNITKSNIIVSYKINTNIIGGMLVLIEDKVYDISIKNQLKELKKNLVI